MSKKYIGNLVQSLSGGSGGGGGGDTGVGKPYPGSTGGEYFNYYGDDSNKNTAEGDYSTTIGYNNKNNGKYSFVCGKDNTVNSSTYERESQFVLGKGNTANGAYYGSFIAGNGNNLVRAGAIIAGNSNRTENDYNWAFGNSNNCQNNGYAAGNNLQARGNFCYGQFNTTTWSLNPKPKVVIGCGTNSNSLKNAIEIDSTECKIINNLQLNADTTSVNAITAPQDSSNVTTDDQTLATKSYVDANSGSGGVGQAYSGSTGGEIFNYYGTDANANTASGTYSTASGLKNKALGNYSFVVGKGNSTRDSSQAGDGTFIAGYNNTDIRGIALGSNNNPGFTNSSVDRIFIGDHLMGVRKHGTWSETFPLVILGKYNRNELNLEGDDVVVVIGCGKYGNRKNAMEISNTDVKIINDLQLATDSTAVNAITPPQDPQNVTADDQTLVTKSYLTSQIPSLTPYSKSQVAYFEEWDNATIIPVDGSSISLTTFGTIPTWSNRAIITFRWENELITKEVFFNKNEGIHLHIVQRAYSAFPETIHYRHMRIEWDYTNNTLTAADYWTYDQDMSNSGAVSNWDHTLSNATTCKILSVVFSE